jgi:hypothetical protein
MLGNPKHGNIELRFPWRSIIETVVLELFEHPQEWRPPTGSSGLP